jgi:hypothetical protein
LLVRVSFAAVTLFYILFVPFYFIAIGKQRMREGTSVYFPNDLANMSRQLEQIIAEAIAKGGKDGMDRVLADRVLIQLHTGSIREINIKRCIQSIEFLKQNSDAFKGQPCFDSVLALLRGVELNGGLLGLPDVAAAAKLTEQKECTLPHVPGPASPGPDEDAGLFVRISTGMFIPSLCFLQRLLHLLMRLESSLTRPSHFIITWAVCIG